MSRYCNMLPAAIISGACIDLAFQISGWKSAISIITIFIILCAANICSDLEEKKHLQDKDNEQHKREEHILEFQQKALQEIVMKFTDLETFLVKMSEEQAGRANEAQSGFRAEMHSLVECERSLSADIRAELSTGRDILQSEIQKASAALAETDRLAARETGEALGAVGDVCQKEIRDAVKILTECEDRILGEMKNEFGVTSEKMTQRICDAVHCVENELEETENHQTDRKNEICGVFEREISEVRRAVEEYGDAVKMLLEEKFEDQKQSLDGLYRVTKKADATITEKAEKIVRSENMLLEKYEGLQKEFIREMGKIAERSENILKLLNDSYNYLNEIINTR